MVKREPNIIRGHLGIFFWLWYASFNFYNTFFVSSLRNHNPLALSIVFFVFFNLGIGRLFLPQERFWHKQNQRRQQAARSDQSFVASFQPTPNATAISLPTTIIQRTVKNWTIYLIIAAIILLALFTFLIYELILQTMLSDILLVLFVIGFVTAAFVYYLVAPVVRGYQQLTVDDDGIHVRVGLGRIYSMRWQDARLFAASSGYKSSSYTKQFPTFYELSNANEVVRWRWIRTRNFVSIEPTLPIHEYDKQMNAVLSLIAAKTGLTLYDVRPEREK
jgi:hypothetical protein